MMYVLIALYGLSVAVTVNDILNLSRCYNNPQRRHLFRGEVIRLITLSVAVYNGLPLMTAAIGQFAPLVSTIIILAVVSLIGSLISRFSPNA